MSASKPSHPRFKRRKTRHRGISYRLRDGGLMTHAVYFQGTNITVERGEKQVLTKQAELRGKAARGERVVTATEARFSEVAERWYEGNPPPRRRTRENYRTSLEIVLIPRLGKFKIATAKLANLNMSLHDARHAFSSRMIARGIQPIAPAKVMGHKNARITLDIYGHLCDQHRTDDVIRAAMA
jgi:integrase